jgi:hypothetical protein
LLWFLGGQASCGEEVYDTPPGSAGDTFCTVLVQPVVPWASLAALPFVLAAIGGFIGIRLRDRRLFLAALIAPFALVAFAVFATVAVD